MEGWRSARDRRWGRPRAATPHGHHSAQSVTLVVQQSFDRSHGGAAAGLRPLVRGHAHHPNVVQLGHLRRLRSGVGILGSIPGVAVVLVIALAVLSINRFLTLENASASHPRSQGTKESEVVRMTNASMHHRVWTAVCETVWAVGTSVAGGLPLLT